MKMAEYLFKELGYNLVRKDDDYIIYEKKVDANCNCTKTISFCEQLQNINVSYEGFNNPTPSIDMQLFRAIEQQLKELAWIA